MRIKAVSLIVSLMAVSIVVMLSMTGCKSENNSEISIESELSTTEKQEEIAGVIGMLKEQGYDTSGLEEYRINEDGSVILGEGLKPAKRYRTLAEAEEDYGDWFGLHNEIECLPDLELIDMLSINGEYLQGVYENDKEESELIVKFSKSIKGEELASVYEREEVVIDREIMGINVHIYWKDDKCILLYFDYNIEGNEDYGEVKSYSIRSMRGLDEDEMIDLCVELINNLDSM